MRKGEGAGLGLSIVGHIGLLVLLSVNMISARRQPKLSEPMDVMLVDKVGLQSAAPTIAKEAPQAAQAPEVAPQVQEAPPPTPTPAPPKPTPAPPKPAVTPQPAPKAAKPEPTTPAPPVATPAPPAPPKAKPKATTLGSDFLKGIPVEKSTGKAAAPRAAAVSQLAMNGLVALLRKQVLPCYHPPGGGIDTSSIVTLLSIKMKRDGTVASVQSGQQTGTNDQNRPYARQTAEAARRAVLTCQPFHLPDELYEGGWEDFDFVFRPGP
jgi:outer membrane biosynthesis protein TonB